MFRACLTVTLSLLLPVVVLAQDAAPNIPPRSGRTLIVQPFNGKDLTGWLGDETLWSIEDGEIAGRTPAPLKKPAFLMSDANVSDFRLTFDVRLSDAESQAGIGFWGHSVTGVRFEYAGPVLLFPGNVAVHDLSESGSLGESTTLPDGNWLTDDWNRVELLAQGNRLRAVINGHLALDWRDPDRNRQQNGPLGLMLPSDSQSREVRFRRFTLELFPEERLTTLSIDERIEQSQMTRLNVDVEPGTPGLWSSDSEVVIPEPILQSIRSGLNERLIGPEIRVSEANSYYAILDKARRVGTARLRTAAAEFQTLRRADPDNARYAQRDPEEFPTFVDLHDHPLPYHGKPVTLRGHILKLIPLEPDENPYGISGMFEAWLYDEDAQSNPTVIVCTSRDERLTEGTEIQIDHVQVSGYFFKNRAYKAQDMMRFGPLILADRLEFYPPEEAERVFRLSRATKVQLLAGGVIVIMILRIVWRFRRQEKQEDSGRRAVRELVEYSPEQPRFDDLPSRESPSFGTDPDPESAPHLDEHPGDTASRDDRDV